MRSGQWIARALLGVGWVGFLFGLAFLCRAYLYQREDELGLAADFTLRGALICAAAVVVALPGRSLVSWHAPATRAVPRPSH